MTRGPSVFAIANTLREDQRFVRPSREDAGRDLCGRRNGLFQVSRTKPGAQLEPFIAEAKHGKGLRAELDGCEFKKHLVGHGQSPFVRSVVVGTIWPRGPAVMPVNRARMGQGIAPEANVQTSIVTDV